MLSGGPCKCHETTDELRAENIDLIGPSIMPKIPDDLRVCFTRSVDDCPCAGKIELMRLRFNQMPAQSLAHRVYLVTLEEPEVAGCELVVFRGPHKIESFTI